MPEWVNEVIERINQQVEGIEMRLRQREDEERQEAEWDVVAYRRFIEERDRRREEWADERMGRRRNAQVRTLEVQSQTNGLNGRFTVLTDREQGVHEEHTENRMMKVNQEGRKTASIQRSDLYRQSEEPKVSRKEDGFS